MANFLTLPVEVRSMIYKFLVTPPHSINPFHKDDRSLLCFSLLYTNKAISQEYRKTLYSEIEFSFEDAKFKDVAVFLQKIGPQNAGLIRYIYIDLPQVYPDSYGGGTCVEENSDRILRKLKSDCTGLRMLIIDLDKASQQLRRLKYINSEIPFYDEAIAYLDERFRDIPSLKTIEVEIPAGGQWMKIISEMEKKDWVLYEMGGKWPDEHGIENEASSDDEDSEINGYDEYADAPWDDDDYAEDDVANMPDWMWPIIGGSGECD